MKTFLTTIFFITTLSVFAKDKGIGILYISSDLQDKIQVNIYERNNIKSRLLGVFNYQHSGNGQNTFSVQVENVKTDNLIEFEYEKLGLPLRGISDNWLNVIYGYDKLGKALTGWIEHKSGTTDYILWKDYFMSKMLFFESTDQIEFFDSPKGIKVEFKLQPSQNLKYDYIMKPVELNGNWMKVEVTTPSHYCNSPEMKETKVFWIKYLDQWGRPLVWYFTRGC